MQVLQFIIELIKIPAVILGLIALIGLLVQKKDAGEVVSGTLKTILGLLIMSVGIGALINALIPIQAMFEAGIPAGGFTTFVTFDEGVIAFYCGLRSERVRFLIPVGAVTFEHIDEVCSIVERTLVKVVET